jgi:penicillin-binding protein 1A
MLRALTLTRRRAALAAAALIVVVTSVAASAWVAGPAATALQARVHSRLHGTGGRAVAASAIAPILRDAVVATEDERFYRHHGIDIIGVIRALPYDLVHLSFAQGASTITEQVGKLLYLGGNDHTLWRKLEDAALALKLEGRYTKEQILAAYLDSAYFGEGAYGAWAASERYFGVRPLKLDTAQATLLAGLIQAPSAYDPIAHPAAARARQVEVLRSLVRNGFLTEEEAAATLARPLRLRAGRTLAPVRQIDLAPGAPTATRRTPACGCRDRRSARPCRFRHPPLPRRPRRARGQTALARPAGTRSGRRHPLLPHRLNPAVLAARLVVAVVSQPPFASHTADEQATPLSHFHQKATVTRVATSLPLAYQDGPCSRRAHFAREDAYAATTVRKILRQSGVPPACTRAGLCWREFLRAQAQSISSSGHSPSA